ncbi:MAG: prepilin-type N-terminal cleavage/methylation domain-containing protein [Candidatus Gracilibacteria bacterium]|nr:prepilin-type N-terminal cleavage/methylation domain-containing protein [Candidatus Gracilibacteria bacterium]
MFFSSNRNKGGFTLVEVMVVVMILGVLFVGLYMGFQPYMKRSRDTKRVANMLQYSNVLETFDKNFDTFPSVYGAGGSPTASGYCLSELPTRGDIAALGNAGKFSALTIDTTPPPRDPDQTVVVPPCSLPGSYVYSRLDYGGGKQAALIAARLEIRTSANYGTGSDLLNPLKFQDDTKKGTVPPTASDQLYVVTRLH